MRRTDHLHIPIPPMTKRPQNSSTICCGDLAKTKNHMQATKDEKIMSKGTRESIIRFVGKVFRLWRKCRKMM